MLSLSNELIQTQKRFQHSLALLFYDSFGNVGVEQEHPAQVRVEHHDSIFDLTGIIGVFHGLVKVVKAYLQVKRTEFLSIKGEKGRLLIGMEDDLNQALFNIPIQTDDINSELPAKLKQDFRRSLGFH